MQNEDLGAGTPLLRAGGLVLILRTAKGRGIFASQFIASGTVIEVCPVLVFSDHETTNYISKTCIDDYTYYWPSDDGRTIHQALALGLGSMFNHSTRQQNVIWTRDLESDCIIYSALRAIAIGEELCISYGSGQLWFDDTEEAQGAENGASNGERLKDYDAGQTLGELELSGLGRMALDLE